MVVVVDGGEAGGDGGGGEGGGWIGGGGVGGGRGGAKKSAGGAGRDRERDASGGDDATGRGWFEGRSHSYTPYALFIA